MSGHDPLSAEGDVLDTGTPGRFGVWVTVAVICALVLLGWQLRDASAPPVARTALAVAEPADVSPEPTTAQWGVDILGEVTFVDDRIGFAVQQQCSDAAAVAFGCGRRLLATGDAGATWEALRWLPTLAEGYDELLALSADELILFDVTTQAGVVRSTDGGRSWVRLPVQRSGPRALAPQGLVVLGGPVICNRQCEPTTVAWFDPASLTVHPLPTQPAVEELARSEFTRATTLGTDIVVGGTTLTGAYVAFSRDSGHSWSQTRLDPELEPGQAVTHAAVTAAGDGRAYAFVQIDDGVGSPTTIGYRTDDGGGSWRTLWLEEQPFQWSPHAVVAGELIVNDVPGRVYMSSGGGTAWATVVDAPAGMWIEQAAPGGPILGTAGPHRALQVHYLSRDGLTWMRMRLPT